MPRLFSRIDGLVGRVDIPDLGAHISDFTSATLVRRGDTAEDSKDPEAEFYDLHAVLRFVNKALFEDADYAKVVTVWQRRNPRRKWILQLQGPNQRMALQGKSLIMERVLIVDPPQKA